MKRFITALLMMGGVVTMTTVGESIKEIDLPAPVREAFARDYPHLKATAYERERADGQIVYEIETRAGGVELDVLYTADGSLFATEREIKPTELPGLHVELIRKHYPEWKVREVAEITRDNIKTYEVELAKDGKLIEVLLSTDGTIEKLPEEPADTEEDEDADEK